MSDYPAPPGARISYDLDGTVGFVFQSDSRPDSSTVVTRDIRELTPKGLSALNSDVSSGLMVDSNLWANINDRSNEYPARLALLFPTPMRLRGALLGNYSIGSLGNTLYRGSNKVRLMGSTDTTNGLDGTWTAIIPDGAPNVGAFSVAGYAISDYKPKGYVRAINADTGLAQDFTYSSDPWNLTTGAQYRRSAAETGSGWVAVSGAATRQLRGVRMELMDFYEGYPRGATLLNLHLYGEPDTNADEDRLSFISTSGGDPDFAYGDLYPGLVVTKPFKMRNRSTVRTASGVEIYAVESSPTAVEMNLPSLASALEFSTNGTTWASTLTVSSLAPGADSATLYMRLTVPSGVLGPRGPRLMAEVGAWS